MKEVKATVIAERIDEFEQFCKFKNIKFTAYPKPLQNRYRVYCNAEDLHDIGHCISILAKMPIVELDEED